MIIGIHISIALNLLALFLFFWLKKQQQMDNDLHEAELSHTHQGMKALMEDFNNYQVETERKIVDLKKQIEIKSNNAERRMDKMNKSLPSIIGKVVGQIELAQDTINRKIQ